MKHLTTLFFTFVLLLCATSLLFAQDKKQNTPAVERVDLGEGEYIYKKLSEPVQKPAYWIRPDLSQISPSAAPGQIYFAEGFEGSWTFGAPPGWTSVPTVNTDSTWHRSEFETGWTAGSSGRPTVRSYYMGGYAARFHSWGAPAGAVGSMMSPNIDLSGATGTCWVSFWWATSGADIINVYTSSDGGSTWTLLGFVGSTGLPWAAAFAPIPTPYTSTMQVRFEGVSDFGANDLNLDEVVVFEEGPAYSGALTLPGTFTDFTDAARKLFIFGVSGPTTISIAPGTYADSATFNVFGSSPVNTVTFMGGGAVTVTRTGSLTGGGGQNTLDAIIDLQGADYTIWDGVNVMDGGHSENGYLVSNQSLDGCQGNIIRNCTVDLSKTIANTIGINQSVFWVPTDASISQSNNYYYNNVVRDLQNSGFRINGSTIGGGFFDLNNVAERNLITDVNATANAQAFRLGGQSGLMLINNTIDSIGVTGNGTAMGILLGSTTAAGDSVVDFKIYGNVIRRLVGPGMTSNIMSGIRVNSSTTAVYRGQIYNNFISDFSSSGTSTSGAVNAFYLSGRERGVDIVYNTVFMDNNIAATGYASIFRVASSGGTFNTQNNIFVNKAANANSWIHIWNTTSTVNFTSSNNTYYVDTTVSATKHIGRRSTINYHTLPAWQAVTGQDANTSYEDVDFINATVKPYDLHVDGTTPSTTESGGVPIAGITTDFDGDARNASYPDIGADEYSGTAVDIFGPTISYTPLSAAANLSDRALNTTVSDLSGVASGADGPRLYYKKSTDVTWQVDAAPTGVPPAHNFTISSAALGGVSVGDVIQYYVAAQDLAPTPNLRTNPTGGAGVSPPGSTPPPVPNSYNVSATVSAFPYLEDFEGAEAVDNTGGFGWYSAPVAGGSNDWVRDVPAKLSGAWSGTKAYVTNATAAYDTFHNGAVYSPVFNFSTASIDPVLRFYHNFDLENNFDGAWLEISVDGGYTWTKHDPVLGTGTDFNTPNSSRWYNNNSASGVGNPPKWSGKSTTYASQSDTGYIQSVTTLTGTTGFSDVRLRWRMQSDFSVQDSGWVVDDVEVLILDLVGPVIAYSPFDTTASLANRTLVATITDNVAVASGVNAPRLYYKKSTDVSYVFVNSTSVVGNDHTFTLDYLLIGGVSGGEIIEYYVAAQDDPAANVSSNPSGASGSSPPGTTPPANPRRYLIELTVSTFPYTEDFEDPPVGKESPMAAGLGWYHKNVRFGATGLDGWVRITPAKPQINAAHSGTKAYVTEAAATHTANYDAVLIAPVFNFSGLTEDPYLEFYHNFKTEADWDGFIVQYSTDGGATWSKLDPNLGTGGNFNTANSQGWYNDGTYLNQWLPGGAPFFGGGHLGGVGSTGYSSAVKGWVRAFAKLSGLAGQSSVRIRFYWSSDEFEVSEGVAIDDVSITNPPVNDISASTLFGTGLNDEPTGASGPVLKIGRAGVASSSGAGVNYQRDRRHRGETGKPQKGQRFMSLTPVAPPSVLRNTGLVDLSAEVTNFGTSAQSTYNVGWAVDGVEQTDVPGDPLPGGPGTKDTVSLSLASASDGLHTARAWTELGVDTNPSNDTSNTLWFNVLPPEVIFYEGFNNAAGVPPPGWLFIDADGTNPGWFQSGVAFEGDGSAGNDYLASTGLYIDEYLITPNTGGVFDATTVDSLSFQALSVAPPFPDSLMIMVSTTGTDTADFTTVLAYLDISSGATFIKYTFALPNAANRYIAFRYLHYDGGPFGNGSNAIRLDDVRITRYTLEVTIGVPVLQSWNMVSLPVSSPVPDDSVSHIFTNSDFPYGFAFNNGYVQRYVMENGPGYWIKSSTAYTQDITGTQRDTLTVPVAMNWNMIGSITTSIDTSVAHVTPSVPGLRVSNFFKYNNGYLVATTIDPGLGYWVKASADASFFMHATTAPGKPSGELVKAQRTVEELNSLTIEDASGGSQTLYFGADANGDIPVSMYAMPPMPPEGSFDARFTSSEGGTMVQTHASVISEIVEMPIAVQSGAYPLTVSWKVNDGSYELSDGAGGSHPLRGEGTLRVTEESSLVLKVTGGSGLPKEFALYQNYPNPFNPATTIKYALPVDSRITVEMYNIVGQRVKTLIDGEQTAGYHVAEWNGTNDAGKQVASGMYFLRMSAEGKNGKKFTDVRKLMLLK